MLSPALELLQPTSLEEALALLAEEDPPVPMAGCTDLYVALARGVQPARRYIDLWALEELRGIAAHGDELRIGAGCTFTQIIGSELVRARLGILVAAARSIGARQIQNRGTLGGNIASASPAADTLPVLAVAEATIVLRSAAGTRRVPFCQFQSGYRRTALRRGELIEAVQFPPLPGPGWFRKVGPRGAQAISKVVFAAVRAAAPRIAIGSVAPTVVRLPRTEAALAAGASIARARELLQGEIAPIDDMRSTAAYRRHVSAALLARFWKESAV